MKLLSRPHLIVLAAAALIGAGATFFTALAVHQDYRLSADDPQVQLATDAAAALSHGQAPSAVVGSDQVEAATSLAPFVTVYGGSQPHRALASSGTFSGQTLTPPAGVFDNAKAHGQERFTWQTATGQREAAVLIYQSSPQPAYVLAARNLREVEHHEHTLQLMFFGTLLGIAVVTAVAAALLVRKKA